MIIVQFYSLRNQPDPQAQAGFMSGEGQSFLLPVSGLDQIQNIDKWSNTDVPGLWIFKVGPLAPLENIIEPEPSDFQSKNLFSVSLQNLYFSSVVDPRTSTTCQEGKAVCHSQAICSDNQFGFCCQCKRGWYGDGKNCLAEQLPQRVNGR